MLTQDHLLREKKPLCGKPPGRGSLQCAGKGLGKADSLTPTGLSEGGEQRAVPSGFSPLRWFRSAPLVRHVRRGFRVLLGVLMGLLQLPGMAQEAWTLLPYRVDVYCGLPPDVQADQTLAETFCGGLAGRLAIARQGQWKVTVSLPPAGEQAMFAAALVREGIAFTPPPSWRKAAERDKVFVLLIDCTPKGWRISARDWDVRVERFGPPVELTVPTWDGVLSAAAQAIEKAFVPLAKVRLVENNAVRLDLRAALLCGTESVTIPRLFLPLARFEDRDGNARGIIPLPWTILDCAENSLLQDGSVECRVTSGVRNPLAARRRGRVQLLAWAIKPQPRQALLTLKNRQDPNKPLAGYDVYAQHHGQGEMHYLGRTDAFGRIDVGSPSATWELLFIKHGRRLLAKVPFVPGYSEFAELALPDDDPRLIAEGYLMGVQDELVDLVTLRNILMARLRARMEAGDWDEATRLRDQLLELKSRDIFSSELTRYQQKLYCPDPVGQKQIDKMFEETQRLVSSYLNPAEVEELVKQIALRRPPSQTPK